MDNLQLAAAYEESLAQDRPPECKAVWLTVPGPAHKYKDNITIVRGLTGENWGSTFGSSRTVVRLPLENVKRYLDSQCLATN